jgi:anti-sigma-K factor RskA
MRFRGLPVNTPSKEQYQLWIFAKNQSDSTPIDGGVFDITSTEEVIIPINAKLFVQDAFMFAVTIEKPGGVVVSSRERLPLLAMVE